MSDLILAAATDTKPVAGLTHDFYRYPARFAPGLASALITGFTVPGDLVLDPFMGGGTTLVEAAALGRAAVGSDLNSLAAFVATVKTRPLTGRQERAVTAWRQDLPWQMNLHGRAPVKTGTPPATSRQSWAVMKSIAMALASLESIADSRAKAFSRCAVLKTGQWALDSRQEIPTAAEFRTQLDAHIVGMLISSRELRTAISAAPWPGAKPILAKCRHMAAEDLRREPTLKGVKPALIMTSPPYPGVHVLYHRWQVRGRRETPAPYWIAGTQDGQGPSYYTFAHRTNHGGYFVRMEKAFRALCEIAGERTVIAQVVGFSDPESQLPHYLRSMERAGFVEDRDAGPGNAPDGRLWRSVPNRKWYTAADGHAGSEVVLFHRKSV